MPANYNSEPLKLQTHQEKLVDQYDSQTLLEKKSHYGGNLRLMMVVLLFPTT